VSWTGFPGSEEDDLFAGESWKRLPGRIVLWLKRASRLPMLGTTLPISLQREDELELVMIYGYGTVQM
jgi:hypothetical protein